MSLVKILGFTTSIKIHHCYSPNENISNNSFNFFQKCEATNPFKAKLI